MNNIKLETNMPVGEEILNLTNFLIRPKLNGVPIDLEELVQSQIGEETTGFDIPSFDREVLCGIGSNVLSAVMQNKKQKADEAQYKQESEEAHRRLKDIAEEYYGRHFEVEDTTSSRAIFRQTNDDWLNARGRFYKKVTGILVPYSVEYANYGQLRLLKPGLLTKRPTISRMLRIEMFRVYDDPLVSLRLVD